MSTTERYNRYNLFTANCRTEVDNQKTGYFFRPWRGQYYLPLIYNSDASNVDESDISDIILSNDGTPLRTFDITYETGIERNVLTSSNINSQQCYAGCTYQGKTPDVEPSDDYNNIVYDLSIFQGLCKVIYHNVGDTTVKYKYSWVGDTLFNLYTDVFGTTIALSGWSMSQDLSTIDVTESNPYTLTVDKCYTLESSSTDPVIDLYPIRQTFNLRLYGGTEAACVEYLNYTLKDSSGTVVLTNNAQGTETTPIFTRAVKTALPSGIYTIEANMTNLLGDGVMVYGWEFNNNNGNDWDYDLTQSHSLLRSDGTTTGPVCGSSITFALASNSDYVVYVNKNYTVNVYCGFNSDNVTMDGMEGSSTSYTNSRDMVTSDSRTVNQLVLPRTYDTWNEAEYISMQNLTRTGYTFKGLGYYASSQNMTVYNVGTSIPILNTDRDYIMLWDAINLNITSKLINYEKTINKKGEEELTEIETSIGKIDTAPSSPVSYDDNVEMETSLAAGIDPILYQRYYQLEGDYEYSGVQSGEDGHKLTLLSKGDINLNPSGGTSMTWEFYDFNGNLQTTSGTAFVYDGTNYSLATPGQEIWRPHTETENYFNGWLINGAEDTDNVLGPYTTVNANGTVSLSVPASVLYTHFGTNIELNPRYVTYNHDIGRREYTVQKLTDSSGNVYVLLYDESNNNVWKGLLPEVTTGTYGIISTSRGNWSLKYKDSQDKYHLITTSGNYTDNTSGLTIDATMSSYVDPPFTINDDIAGRFNFS